MDLDVLARLIGPPPQQTPLVDWASVEEELGLRLPADFKAIASAYGPIDLGEFVWVWSPVGAAARFDHGTHRWLRALRDRNPASYPYTFWPEPGGLLLWGLSLAVRTTSSGTPAPLPTRSNGRRCFIRTCRRRTGCRGRVSTVDRPGGESSGR